MANRWGNNGNSETLFSWAPKSLQMVTAAMKLKDTCSFGKESTCNVGDLVSTPQTQKELDMTERLSHTHTRASWKKSCDQPGQHIKKQRH